MGYRIMLDLRGYKRFTLGRDGTWVAIKVFFKKVDYPLTLATPDRIHLLKPFGSRYFLTTASRTNEVGNR